MPTGFSYGLQANCFAHSEQLWIQLIKPGNNANQYSGGRDDSTKVDVEQISQLIERAWRAPLIDAFGIPAQNAPLCLNMSLETWMRGETRLPPREDLLAWGRVPKLACGKADPRWNCTRPPALECVSGVVVRN